MRRTEVVNSWLIVLLAFCVVLPECGIRRVQATPTTSGLYVMVCNWFPVTSPVRSLRLHALQSCHLSACAYSACYDNLSD